MIEIQKTGKYIKKFEYFRPETNKDKIIGILTQI